MKKFFRYSLYIFCIVQLTACATNSYVDQYEDIEGFNEKRKGIIIVQAVNKLKDGSEDHNFRSTWKNKNASKYFSMSFRDTLGIGLDILSYDTMVYFIEPGEYTLADLCFNGKCSNLASEILGFSVVGGEARYIGKIVTNPSSKIVVRALDIEDCYDTAKKYFEQKYPQINQVPKKHLIQFTQKAHNFKKGC